MTLKSFAITFCILLLALPKIFGQDKSIQIDEYVKKYYELGQFNGSILVAKNGSVIYSKGFGYADMENKIPNETDTKFRLASITKQFTATLILQLVEQGKIKLDGKLSDYLPYYRKDTGEKITISQILSHTAGLDNYTDDNDFMKNTTSLKFTPKEFIIGYCSNDLISEPGTKYAYSNSGYFILGGVIEEVTGKTYEEVLQENIFGPLEMKNSGYEVTGRTYEDFAKGYVSSFGEYKPARFADMSIPYSAGAIYSTVEDMHKWDRALYTEQILSSESLEKMFTPNLDNYGYGWHIFDAPLNENKMMKVITHSGGIFGFNSIETRLEEDGIFVMVLNNFEGGNINKMTQGIIHIVYGMEAPEPRPSLALMLAKEIRRNSLSDAIVNIISLKDKSDEYMISEREFNKLGYTFLQDGKVNEAIEVFKLNVEMFPGSANVYDSLGEAYAKAGDKDNALKNYRKALEMEPANAHAKKMLVELESK
jgi:CubicO group peptidase (beta-lactamase class C family)